MTTKTNYPPAPWFDNDIGDGDGPLAIWTSREYGGKFICSLSYPFPESKCRAEREMTADERRAVARLIVAAPIMLEALRDISSFEDINRVSTGNPYPPWIETARAAIAAAEGEGTAEKMPDIETAARVIEDTKKKIFFDKSAGCWRWCDRDEADNFDAWQGSFPTFLAAMRDAAAPYIE